MRADAHDRTAYLYGCRCETCRDACARYERGRQWDILSGNPRTVPVVGAKRRVQALQRIGWSAERLSIELGHSRAWLHVTLTRDGGRLYRRNHEAIAALYDRLRYTPGPSAITARRAAAADWPEPDAWWDIDDPAEQPDPGYTDKRAHDDHDPVVVDRILGGDSTLARTATKAERVEVVARWRADGRPLNELERLTRWEPRRYLSKDVA